MSALIVFQKKSHADTHRTRYLLKVDVSQKLIKQTSLRQVQDGFQRTMGSKGAFLSKAHEGHASMDGIQEHGGNPQLTVVKQHLYLQPIQNFDGKLRMSKAWRLWGVKGLGHPLAKSRQSRPTRVCQEQDAPGFLNTGLKLTRQGRVPEQTINLPIAVRIVADSKGSQEG